MLLQLDCFSANMPLPEDLQVYGLTEKGSGKNEADLWCQWTEFSEEFSPLYFQKNKLPDFLKKSS